jgi:hypothetical protein
MALSEYELRILHDIEDSLQDVERRCAAIQRRMLRRHSRLWLILLCALAPLVGAGLILLGAMTHHDGIVIAVLGSAVLAIPCVGVSPLCNQRH